MRKYNRLRQDLSRKEKEKMMEVEKIIESCENLSVEEIVEVVLNQKFFMQEKIRKSVFTSMKLTNASKFLEAFRLIQIERLKRFKQSIVEGTYREALRNMTVDEKEEILNSSFFQQLPREVQELLELQVGKRKTDTFSESVGIRRRKIR